MNARPKRTDAAEAIPVLGIACPHCGSHLDSVFFTRRIAGQILRVRKCGQCRSAVRTSERIVATHVPRRRDKPAAH